jgi:hypothetical protein
MCCKLLKVDELAKPRQEWCSHCDIGVGCKIYDTKPSECSKFLCGWIANANISDVWKPSDCRMVLTHEPSAGQFVIHVDASRGDVWRREPFYSEIKRWSAVALNNGMRLFVFQGLETVAVLPDREINLGRRSSP